jgi:membrane fusion protein, multidrug efflux system
MNDNHSEQPEKRGRSIFLLAALAILISLILISGMIWRHEVRLRQEEKSRKDSVAQGPRVRVATAKKAPQTRSVVLIGEAFPYANVALYAKISGYLQEIRVDKGDKVRADQVIAIIDSPELNKQYAAARADARNKRVDAERFQYLLKSGSVSIQNAENAETTAKIAEDNAAALKAQKDYEVIRAPFEGIITARYADPGALLQAATTGQTQALPVVALSQTDRLRVYVYPDQRTASSVQIGDRAEVADATKPDSMVTATVSRTTGQLDAKTRTLLVEIELDNRAGKFLAGSFVQVTLFVRIPPTVEIPVEGLVMRGNTAFVGVVDGDNKATFRQVTVFASDGKTVKLSSGLSKGDQVMLNVGDSVTEGQKVRPQEEKSKESSSKSEEKKSDKSSGK